MRTTVIGTGIMGAGMARSLARAGHDVTVWNRTREKAEPLAQHDIRVADSVADAVDGARVVLTMLYDADATAEVAEQMLPALADDAVWMQSATVGVDGNRRLHEAGGDRYLDAPVLGTRGPAEQGELVVLVAGPSALRDTASPVFHAIGSRTVVAGDEPGAASALKLACNAWVATMLSGTAQSLALAQALGIDPELFLDAIEGGALDAPYVRMKGRMMLDRDWATPMFELDGVVKDVGLMVEAAGPAGFPTGLLEALHSLFAEASAQGRGGEDMAAVRTAFS
jgi:3-hydroxyisobutyrate dehydrogenase